MVSPYAGLSANRVVQQVLGPGGHREEDAAIRYLTAEANRRGLALTEMQAYEALQAA
jgi:hypothetical protein